MRVLAPALLMSFLISGSTALAQYPCGACQSPAVSSPPAAYYYPVPYAVPTYVYAQPQYYAVPMYYIPVAVKCDTANPAPESPATPEPTIDDAIPAFRGAAETASTGRVRVYSRVLDRSGRVVSGAQSFRAGMATDHASMVANNFQLIEDRLPNASEVSALKAARTKRLNAEAAKSLDTFIKAENQKAAAKAAPAAAKAPQKKPDDCADQISELKKSIEALTKQQQQLLQQPKPATAPQTAPKPPGSK